MFGITKEFVKLLRFVNRNGYVNTLVLSKKFSIFSQAYCSQIAKDGYIVAKVKTDEGYSPIPYGGALFEEKYIAITEKGKELIQQRNYKILTEWTPIVLSVAAIIISVIALLN